MSEKEKKIKKLNKIGLFILVLFALGCVLVIIWGVGIAEKTTNEQIKFYCSYSKLKMANGIIEDMGRQTEHSKLCSDEECELFFEEKNNRSKESLEKVLNWECYENFVKGGNEE